MFFGLGLWFSSFSYAESRLPDNFKVFSERIGEYQEPVAGETTVEMIQNLFLKNVVPIGRYVLIGISLLYFGMYAYNVAIGMGKDDQYTSQQKNIVFAALGFAIIGGADILVTAIDPMINPDPTTPFDENVTRSVLQKLINFMEVPLGAIAIILLFYGSFKMITQSADKDAVKYGKNLLMYGFIGFIFVMLADPLVNLIFYPNSGLTGVGTPQAQEFVSQGFGLLRYLFIFFGVATFIMFLYSGFLYMTAGSSDDGPKKAKEAFKWSVIGLFVVLISYSLVMFFIPETAK